MPDLGKKSGGWSSIERLILCMICLLWAVKRHSPRLAGQIQTNPFFTMSMSGTHAQSRGETRCGPAGRIPAHCIMDGLAEPKLAAFPRFASEGWWSQTGSNRRPQACKASALPTELWPQWVSTEHRKPSRLLPHMWWAWEDLNFRPHAYQARALTN